MKRFRELPLPLLAHLTGTVLLALLVVAWVAPQVQWLQQWGMLLGLMVLSVVFGLAKVRLPLQQQWISLGTTAITLAQLTLGTPAAVACGAVVAMLATFVDWRGAGNALRLHSVPVYRALFNIGACVLAAGLAGRAYEALHVYTAGLGPQAMVPGLAVWAAVYFLVNTGSVARAISLSSGKPFGQLWRQNCLWTAPGYFAAAALAAGIHLTYSFFGFWAVLPLPLLYVIYEAYREHAAREELQSHHIQELNRLTESVMASLAMAIEAKDRYTREHIHRVQYFAVSLAEALGVDEGQREAVRLAALVHDVGKIAIPERILTKPGKLTPDEFGRMKTHVTIGAMILDPVRFPYPVVEAVRSHHERWDGFGYPDGLRGEAIPLGGRIIAIADVFDALTSDRPYRKAMQVEEALKMLRQGAGSQFDPELVTLFEQIYPQVCTGLANIHSGESELPGSEERVRLPEQVFTEIAAAAGEDMAAALELSQTLLANPDDDLLRRTMEQVEALIPSMTAVAYEVDATGEELVATTVMGSYAAAIQGMVIRQGEGITGRAAKAQRSFLNASALLDVGRVFDPDEHIELSAALCVPVVVRDETVAVLALYHTSYEIYNDHHLRILSTMAAHLASAIESRRQSPQDRALAADPATGLYNARYVMQLLDQRLPLAAKDGDSLSVIVLDLEGVKGINQRYGHVAGDLALDAVAAQLRRCARQKDIVFRYAGAEYVIVLEGAGQEEASRFADRVREAVDEVRVQDGVRLGCSIGVAVFPEDGASMKSLIDVADARMYDEKARHRIIGLPVASSEPSV